MGGIAVVTKPRSSTRIRIALERWDQIWPDARELAEAHHRLVGSPWRHEIDAAAFGVLYLHGMLKILAARDGTEALRGYCLWFITPNFESRGMQLAQQGPWYAAEAGLGFRLLRESYRLMPSWGVDYALPHHWANEPRLGLLFRRMGDVPLETVYLHKVERATPALED